MNEEEIEAQSATYVPSPAGGGDMSRTEAATILMQLARQRSRTASEVDALQMGTRMLLRRFFQQMRRYARRRAAAVNESL